MKKYNIEKKDSYIIATYILKLVPKYLTEKLIINLIDNTLIINTDKKYIYNLINFLKNHWSLQYKTLIALTAVDYPENKERFELNYFLLSYKLNHRILIKTTTTDTKPILSIVQLYKGANWYEREVCDLYGIFFLNHPDLRRLITDYGFEGYPLRKDFPQTGFLEIRYDDQQKSLLYEPLEMSQEYRSFDFVNPWVDLK